MRRLILLLLLACPVVANAQGTVNARLQAGDGTPITNTTPGRLDVTTQSAIQANAGTNLNTSALALDATLTNRFPAAVASADNIAAQTATLIHGLGFMWDGSAWDRLVGNSTDGLLVNLGANNDVTVTSGSITANAGTNLNTSALLLEATYTGRMPAGASPADNESNTNTALSRIGTFNFIFDGSTWDRWTGAITQGTSPWVSSLSQTGSNNDVDVLTLPSVTIGTFPDNEPVNVAQMNGVAVTMGNGAAGTGVQRVTIASDSTGQVAVASFPDNEPFNQAQVGGAAVVAGACEREQPLYVQINQTANTQLITGTASERIYICSFQALTATAQNVALVDGTGSVCATLPTGLLGGSTAATGWNFAANTGIVLPETNKGWTKTSTDADNVCLLQSGAGQVSGSLSYVSLANL